VKQSGIFKLQPRSGANIPLRSSNLAQQDRLAEAPHVASSVYMKTLVLWTAAAAKENAELQLRKAVLENGILIIGCLETMVATKLGNILRCLNNRAWNRTSLVDE
jgi:hypothetical protein